MCILGIDPGVRGTGYALLETFKGKLELRYSGAIISPPRMREGRLKQIYTEICKILKTDQPDVVAIEDTFFAKNAKSAFTLGAAHGIARLAAEMYDLPIKTYAPTAVKMAVVGFGGATKTQVMKMVAHILNLPQPIRSEHEADAIAVAICHAHSDKWQQIVK